MQLRSPAETSPRGPRRAPFSPKGVNYGNGSSEGRFGESAFAGGSQQFASPKTSHQSLSVTHPRPRPVKTDQCDAPSHKMSRRPDKDAENLASPDALYFGKRSRRTYGMHASRRTIAVEPSFLNLKTSSRIQKVEDEEMSP